MNDNIEARLDHIFCVINDGCYEFVRLGTRYHRMYEQLRSMGIRRGPSEFFLGESFVAQRMVGWFRADTEDGSDGRSSG